MTFFTATIKEWKCLFFSVEMTRIVIASLQWLSDNSKANIHGFVVMPNHVHFLWSKEGCDKDYALEQNFLSFTAHKFQAELRKSNPKELEKFRVETRDREYNFWQARSRSIEIVSRTMAEQKLDYIHYNPCAGKWNLAASFVEYQYSSASYYELEKSPYRFIKHYADFFRAKRRGEDAA